LDEQAINNKKINEIVLDTITKAKERDLSCTVGGGVSAESLPFFENIPRGCLDRYETRKVCFNWQGARSTGDKAILKALGFEVLWLRNKLNYYEGISTSDKRRMHLIEQRYWKAIDGLL
jgi:hypothetical protein